MIEKSLKDLSWQVTEEEYRADPAYSYSTLARFYREGFENLNKLYDKTTSPSLTFGSMVDTLLTDGEEAFNDRFICGIFEDVEDSIVKIIQYLFNNYKDTYISLEDIPNELIIEATEVFSYRSNWKPETRAKVIKEKGSSYYNMLLISEGKEIVSTENKQDAYDCVDILRTSDTTKWYFQKDNPFEDTERLYQLKFKGDYNGIPLRIMADLIIVDHKNKIIYPCDLKTSFKPEYRFYKSFVEWCYFIQGSLYAEIIKQNIMKDPYFKDFKIANYRFIVICNKTRVPLVWEWKYTWSINDVVLGNYTLPNWRSILTELHYYLNTNTNVPIGINTECNDISKWLENGR